jgi:phage tail-like protein
VADGNGHHPDGDGAYRTFVGAGFGTLVVQSSATTRDAPPAASNRAYLRDALPSLYQEGDFAMRFVGALETLLDPIVGVLDALPAHFDPDHAPQDVLGLLSHWVGVRPDESLPLAHRRELVRRAAEVGRKRGTKAGLALALELSFPGLPMRVEDPGGVSWGSAAASPPADPRVIVYCEEPVDERTQASIARCIEENKPAHIGYKLRVRAPRRAVSQAPPPAAPADTGGTFEGERAGDGDGDAT